MFRRIQYNIAKFLNFPINPGNDRRVQAMKAEIERLGGKLNFTVRIYEDGWLAQCKEVTGIITGGPDVNPTDAEINDSIRDAVFSTFGIPPYLCKDELLRNTREIPRKEEKGFVFA